MSDEKMRDLMGRMAGMSPEPPDFPDEVPMARPVESRRSGALVFAAAGLAVLLLAVPFVLWKGPGGTIASDGSTTTLDPGSVTTGPSESGSLGGVVFLTQNPTGSYTGDPTLVPVYLWADYGPGDFSENMSVWEILTRPDLIQGGIPEGFGSSVAAGIRGSQGGGTPKDGRTVWAVDMDANFLEGTGGLLSDFTMLNQLVYSITAGRPDDCVLFTVNGQPIEAFGTDGLDLTDPVCRDTFIDHVNLIFLTEPVTAADGKVTVKGMSNVFEASVSYKVVAPGVEDFTGFTTAECGTGCWGAFEFTLDATQVPEGARIEVYADSPKDGSPLNVVTIPRAAIHDVDGTFSR